MPRSSDRLCGRQCTEATSRPASPARQATADPCQAVATREGTDAWHGGWRYAAAPRSLEYLRVGALRIAGAGRRRRQISRSRDAPAGKYGCPGKSILFPVTLRRYRSQRLACCSLCGDLLPMATLDLVMLRACRPCGATTSGSSIPTWCGADAVLRAPAWRGRPGSGPFWAALERAHVRAVDHRLGPVQRPGGIQLRQQRLVQPLPTPAWCQSRSRRHPPTVLARR